MDEWIEEFRHELLGSEPIAARTIARIVQKFRFIDERDLDLARTLTTADVNFLDSWQIDQVIGADLTDERVQSFAKENYDRYARIGNILPNIFQLLKNKSNFSLRYAIDRLNDLAHDFSLPPSDRRRLDKVVNDKLRSLARTKAALQRATLAISQVSEDYLFAQEYQTQVWAAGEAKKGGNSNEYETVSSYPSSIDALGRSLDLASIAIDIVVFDLKSDLPRERQRHYRMTKQDVVSLAYDLHLSCGGPPLVTTPGSDFSYLCSLIYEVSAGEMDQSLAGAIIEFSRSRQRKEEDEYQIELQDDEVAFENQDNFYLNQKSAQEMKISAEWYITTSKNPNFNQAAKRALLHTALALMEDANRQASVFGPFIVWASQLPATARAEWHQENEEATERLREARILLGKARRAQRDQS